MLIILFPLWIMLFAFAVLSSDSVLLINWLALLLWFITILYILKRNIIFSTLALPILFAFTFTGISSFIVEYNGLFLSEIREQASLTGAFSRIISLCAIIVISSLLSFKITSKIQTITTTNPIIPRQINKGLLFLLVNAYIIISIILLCTFLIYGHPNSYGVDRFYYWNNIAPKWIDYLKFQSSQLTIFVGLLFALTLKKRYILIFVLHLISLALVGEKFTGIFFSSLTFLIPFAIFHWKNVHIFEIIKKPIFLIAILILSLFLFLTIYLSYSSISGENMAINRFLDRLALQSQLWWSLDQLTSFDIQHLASIKKYFLGLDNDNKFMQGIFFIMYLVSPDSVYAWFINQNINMTMGGPINLLYFFGYLFAPIVALILGMLLGCFYMILYKALLLRDILLIFLALKGLDALLRAIAMGDGFYLLSTKTISTIFLFIIYTIITYYYSNKRINK